MNYRHVYHAGNFADVLKHAVLALVIEHMKLKESSFRVIDTHAGIGRYDLASAESLKTGEWREGIGRLLGTAAAPLPASVAQILAPYLNAVRAENPGPDLTRYPGSPAIAHRLMRPHDVLVLNELHPADAASLEETFAGSANVKVLQLDAWIAIKSLLPPKERRGVVLIDPPYEAKDELHRLLRGLADAIKRFATGTLLLWYPVKERRPADAFHGDLVSLGLPVSADKLLRVELYVRAPDRPDQLNGCGLLIANPPWTLAEKLGVMLPFLAERLAAGPGAGFLLRSARFIERRQFLPSHKIRDRQ
jgi:23S rRNA (adenine2030-N6)-methyltransferase